jgi:hypothetical protein
MIMKGDLKLLEVMLPYMNYIHRDNAFLQTIISWRNERAMEMLIRSGVNYDAFATAIIEFKPPEEDDEDESEESHNLQINYEHAQPVIYILEKGDVEMLEVLLKNGLDVNKIDYYGKMNETRMIEILRLLIKYGLNDSSLYYNVILSNKYYPDEVISLAWKAGAYRAFPEDIKVRGMFLHRTNSRIIRLFLTDTEKPLDPNAPGLFSIALKEQSSQIAQLLLEYGARPSKEEMRTYRRLVSV